MQSNRAINQSAGNEPSREASHEERIFLPHELRSIPVKECGEPLVVIQDRVPTVPCAQVLPETAEKLGSDRMLCREGVSERLHTAAVTISRCAEHGVLPEGSRLLVGYAYRAPEVQGHYFEMARDLVRQKCPELINGAEIEAEASKFVNPVDVAGHPAGAALDVTIIDKFGNEFPMGTPFLSFEQQADLPVFSFKDRDPEIHQRRMVLREAMLAAGFAPFAGEWWHFSYGDRDWAMYYHKPHAIYGPVTSAEAKALLHH